MFDTTSPSAHFTVVGLVNGDTVTDVTLSSTGAAATATVGGSPYPILISGALGTGLSNYDITYENAELTVDPKALTVSATDQSKTYGSLFVFDTTSPSAHFTVVGLVNGDTVTDVTLSSTGAAATATVGGSPYPILISGALGTGLSNYDITYENAELTVDPAPLSVTPDLGQSKIYGASEPTLTYGHGTLYNGDTDSVFTGVLSRAAGQNVGTYAISQGTLSAGANYTIVFTTGRTFAITPRDLTRHPGPGPVEDLRGERADPDLRPRHALQRRHRQRLHGRPQPGPRPERRDLRDRPGHALGRRQLHHRLHHRPDVRDHAA